MALPFDYDLKVANNDRAYWDAYEAGASILIPVKVGAGAAGSSVIRARLPMPYLQGLAIAQIARFVNIQVLPVGSNSRSTLWSLSGFAIDTDGYFYFTLYNHSPGNQGETGEFMVTVDRITWSN